MRRGCRYTSCSRLEIKFESSFSVSMQIKPINCDISVIELKDASRTCTVYGVFMESLMSTRFRFCRFTMRMQYINPNQPKFYSHISWRNFVNAYTISLVMSLTLHTLANWELCCVICSFFTPFSFISAVYLHISS